MLLLFFLYLIFLEKSLETFNISRESSYAPPHCNRCCGCPAQITRRHRSSSPTRRSCSLRPRCSSHRSVPRHAHSHHDLRPETDTESESDSSHLRGDRVGSGRRTLYTAELWSRYPIIYIKLWCTYRVSQ